VLAAKDFNSKELFRSRSGRLTALATKEWWWICVHSFTRASVQGRTAEATCSAKSLHRSTDKKFKKRHAVEALIFR